MHTTHVYFCNDCQQTSITKVLDKKIPCQQCESTAYYVGFIQGVKDIEKDLSA